LRLCILPEGNATFTSPTNGNQVRCASASSPSSLRVLLTTSGMLSHPSHGEA